MRYRIKDYLLQKDNDSQMVLIIPIPDSITEPHQVAEALRLVVDEDHKIVLLSSMQKDNVNDVTIDPQLGQFGRAAVITLRGDFSYIADKDECETTVEVDWGDALPSTLAKESAEGRIEEYAKQAAEKEIPTVEQVQRGLAKEGEYDSKLSAIDTQLGKVETAQEQIAASVATLTTLDSDIKKGMEELALQGTDTEATLTAIKAIVESIPTLTYTDALAAIKAVVDSLPKSTLTAADKADILQAIQDATPTIDFTEVLNAIANSEQAIKQALPTDYATAQQVSEINSHVRAISKNVEEIKIPAAQLEAELVDLKEEVVNAVNKKAGSVIVTTEDSYKTISERIVSLPTTEVKIEYKNDEWEKFFPEWHHPLAAISTAIKKYGLSSKSYVSYIVPHHTLLDIPPYTCDIYTADGKINTETNDFFITPKEDGYDTSWVVVAWNTPTQYLFYNSLPMLIGAGFVNCNITDLVTFNNKLIAFCESGSSINMDSNSLKSTWVSWFECDDESTLNDKCSSSYSQVRFFTKQTSEFKVSNSTTQNVPSQGILCCPNCESINIGYAYMRYIYAPNLAYSYSAGSNMSYIAHVKTVGKYATYESYGSDVRWLVFEDVVDNASWGNSPNIYCVEIPEGADINMRILYSAYNYTSLYGRQIDVYVRECIFRKLKIHSPEEGVSRTVSLSSTVVSVLSEDTLSLLENKGWTLASV